MKYKKRLVIILILLIIGIGVFQKFHSTGKVVGTQIEVVPLSTGEMQKVVQTLSSSDFVKDVPPESPISIRFFSFSGGERIWHDAVIIGENKEPIVYLTLDAKYISEFNQDNLCEVIKKANQNRDLGFYSEYSKATLLWKYKSMLQYRDCFGF